MAKKISNNTSIPSRPGLACRFIYLCDNTLLQQGKLRQIFHALFFLIIFCFLFSLHPDFTHAQNTSQGAESSQVLEKPQISLTAEEKAWLKAHPDIVLGYNNSFEPAAIVDPDGSYSGIVVDFLEALNKRLGIHIALRIDPVPIMHAKAKAKETDGIALIHPNYADKLGFLKTKTYYRSYPTVFGPNDISFEQPDNFVGKKVAIIDKVYFSETIIHPYKDRATVLKVKDAQEGLDLVHRKKVDLFFGISTNNYLITKNRLFGIAPKYVFRDSLNKFGMAIRPDWPILVSILNKGIASFSEEELDTIVEKWINPPQQNADSLISLTAEEQAWLKAHPDIQLGYTDAFEPEVIVNPDGSHTGILVDFLEALNKRLGTRITLRIDSIPGILQKAKTKEVDGILEMHPEYADKLGLLKSVGYLRAYPAVFARKDVSFAGPDDFAGKKIAIIDKVYFTEKMVREYGEQSTILRVKDAIQGMKSVSDGTADLYIGVSFNSYYITKYQLFDVVIKYVFDDFPDKFGMAVRPDWPELVPILNKGIASFSQNEIDTIVAKWIHLQQQENTIELTSEEQAWLAAHPKITLGAGKSLLLLIFVDSKGKAAGLDPDYAKLISSLLGIDFQYVSGDWAKNWSRK